MIYVSLAAAPAAAESPNAIIFSYGFSIHTHMNEEHVYSTSV